MNRSVDSGHPAAVLGELLDARYSCRGYRPEPVPRDTIETILSMAQRTASWCNSQAWQVVVAGAAATQRLREQLLEYVREHPATPDFAWPAYQGVYLERRRECGLQLYRATGVTRGDTEAAERQRMENFRFFGAPHVALVTTDESLGVYGAIDCGAYVSNFSLAARAMGVACIAQAAVAAHPAFWRERLGLTPDRKVVCGISFGFEDPAHPANSFRTSRVPVARAATWIEYGS
jgi:nitroreductase